MLEIVGSILTGVLSGGATGLIGILIQRFFDMKSKQQDLEVVKLNHANALALKKAELEGINKQVAGQIAVAQEARAGIEAQAQAQERSAAAQADADAYVASVAADRATYLDAKVQGKSKVAMFLMGMVDWVRGMTRPLLTAYLVIITHLMFNWVVKLAEKHGTVLTTTELKEIITMVIGTLLYLATVSVVWWFGTRPPRAPVTTK